MDELAHRSLAALDVDRLLARAAALAATRAGARAVRQVAPAHTPEQVAARLARVREAMELAEAGEPLPLGGIADVGPLVERAARGVRLAAPELVDVARTLEALQRLHHHLARRAEQAPALAALAPDLEVDRDLATLLGRAFDDRGQLADAAWPELRRLRRAVAELDDRIARTLRELVTGRLADALQDRFVTTREGRTVLPVRAGANPHAIGIVHGSSASGETLFVEPAEIVALNNRRRMALDECAREEARILGLLSQTAGSRSGPLLRALGAAARLDRTAAFAELGRRMDACVPRTGAEGVLDLRAMRHPLLVLGGGEVVPNDIRLDSAHPGLVVSGPNAGGKTVVLKSAGLAAWMVRVGMPVPCHPESRVDLLPSILVELGDRQDLDTGLSTFSAHARALGEILERAGPGALVLLDEVAAGTDPAQGAALALAVLQEIVDAGARVIATTHADALKALPTRDARFVGAAMGFREGRPTWRMRTGGAGGSHALAVARSVGLPERVLRRAREHLGETGRQVADLLEELAALRAEADHRLALLERRERALAERERALAEGEARLVRERSAIQERLVEPTRRRLQEAEDEVRRLVAALQADPELARAGHTLEAIRRIRDRTLSRPEPFAPVPVRPRTWRPGEDAILDPDGAARRVRVLSAPRRGRVEVAAGAMRIRVPVERLAPAPRSTRAPSPRPAPAPRRHARPARVRTPANTVDLRGRSAEEAVEEAARAIDRMALAGVEVIYLLHGHGTGALKRALRAWLPDAPLVRAWAPADPEEGGDAFTRVELG